jgi:exosortase H (IPTLxxWG-CTERM-specific)
MNHGKRQRDPKARRHSPAGRMGPAAEPSNPVTSAGRPFHRHPVLRFVLTFTVLVAAFYAVAFFTPFCRQRLVPSSLRWTAKLAGAALACLGQEITVTDMSISAPRFSVRIVQGCNAIEPIALFTCAVLAFPLPLLRKIPGIVVGSVCLAVLNCVRIVSLFLIGTYLPGIFRVMHIDVWQGVFVLFAMVLWLLWLLWAMQGPVSTEQASH